MLDVDRGSGWDATQPDVAEPRGDEATAPAGYSRPPL